MPRVTYSEAQMDEARAAVFRYGSLRAAERETGYSRKALTRWTQAPGHAQRYQQLCRQLRAQVEDQLIDDFTATVAKSVAVTNEALEATSELLEARNYKDAKAASDAAKNGALIAGIGVDKSRLMQDKPTSINSHERRDLDDILHSLNTLVPGLVVDSTAQDITPTSRALVPDSPSKRVKQLSA